MSQSNFNFGITREFPCSYLPDQKEKLVIAVDERMHNTNGYAWLMANGFRRSGNQIYRPHCEACNACQSIRVLTQGFKPSRSQRRLLRKNEHLSVKTSSSIQQNYFELFERYINTLHSDGSMYPAKEEQFYDFIKTGISEQLFMEVWDSDKLVNVAVTDVLHDGLSAVYTFYDPDYRKSSMGMYSILQQINLCVSQGRPFLYLGYQIDDCQKMNYKTKFSPYQRFIENNWRTVK